MDRDQTHLLRDKALEYGISLSEHQLKLFRIYLDELWEWNQRIRLTGASTRERMTIELFLDSLIPAPFLPDAGRMLDVGSGAGLPGVPLSIYKPRLRAQLLEANSKKVSFLRQIIRLLGLDKIEVIRGRVDKDQSILHPRGYHLITARALARLGQTIQWCAPLLSPGGFLVAFLGRQAAVELGLSQEIMGKEQVFVDRVIPYYLPGKKSRRHIVLLKKRSAG